MYPLLPEMLVITWTYWFCCARMSLERTLLMVTRFVSVPEYPANAKHPPNEAVLVGARLKIGHRNGKKNKNTTNSDSLSLELRLLGIPLLGLWGNWVEDKPLPVGKSTGKVLSSTLLLMGVISS